MAWRVLQHQDQEWNVTAAAERRANSPAWKLVLAFRSVGGQRRSLWANYPLESPSQSSLFAQAERLSDEVLRAVLAQRLA